MKPDFALNLSHDGLSLLHRQPDGWGLMGDVALDDPAMAKKLKALRQRAVDLAGPEFCCKLVIPNSQILYREMSDAELGGTASRRAILDALDGATPYAVEDLVFDWTPGDDAIHHVAAVARETLDEAEGFATEHRFNPVSFVAIPEVAGYPGEPQFGATGWADTILAAGEQVQPDDTAITVVELAPPPASPADPVVPSLQAMPPAPPAGENAPDLAQADLPEPAPPVPAEPLVLEGKFSTRRSMDVGPDLIVPNPNRPSARFMLYADKFEHVVEPLPDLGLGAAEESPADIQPGTVTAPALPGEKRKTKEQKPSPKRQNPPMVTAQPRQPAVPPAPTATDHEPAPQTNETRPSKALDGENLTVFGARRTERDRTKAPPVGMLAAIATVIFVSLAFLAWALFPSTTAPEMVDSEAAPAPALRIGEADQSQSAAVVGGAVTQQPQANPAPQTIDSVPPSAADEQLANLSPDTPDPTPTPDEQLAFSGPQPDTEDLVLDGDPGLDGDALTLETARAQHADTGIWPLSPAPPVDLDVDGTEGIYVASIDRQIVANDAVALPAGLGAVFDLPLREMLSPPPAGTTFDLDDRGLVRARPEGSLTPQGILIFLGRPAVTPLLRPGSEAVEPVIEPTDLPSPNFRPIARPADLIEIDERSRLGGRTRTQLAAIRPLARPASTQDVVPPENTEPTEFAVLASRAPTTRPNGFSSIVEKAIAEALASAPATTDSTDSAPVAAASTPAIPTTASVARAATNQNAINLSQVNLIGVYGSTSDRRALVRLKNGRFVKVQVGDRLDGGKVAAIGTNRLQYTKSGRTLTLEIAS